jgi:predicted patatin/cPLA2 family phospholipase
MYNAQLQYIEEQAQKGNVLVIYPEHSLDIGRIELDEPKLRAIYQHGREKGLAMLDEVRKYLSNSSITH